MKEDIIRMVREARGYPAAPTDGSLWLFSESHLERFAALVAAAEREACAKVCASMVSNDADWDSHHWNQAVQRCEFAIRARGQA